MEPNIIRGPRRDPPAVRTDLPAPKRSSALDRLTVPEVVAVLNLWWANRHGRVGESRDGEADR